MHVWPLRAIALVVSAGSISARGAGPARAPRAALRSTREQVSAVLGNGPDPGTSTGVSAIRPGAAA